MNTEQRSFFRIDDQLKLSWHIVDNNEAIDSAELDVEIKAINTQLNSLISLAFQEFTPVGEALGLLNRKLDLLTTPDDKKLPLLNEVKVNLSGSGIRFASDKTAQTGDIISITLTLKPSNIPVTLRSKVVRCEENNEEKEAFWIRASFENGQDIATEQIVQHVNLRQTELLAAKHHQGELEAILHNDEKQSPRKT